MRVLLVTVLLGTTLAVTGCGGDNLELCDGCGTPTPSVTPTSTAATNTPTPGTPTPSPARTRTTSGT